MKNVYTVFDKVVYIDVAFKGEPMTMLIDETDLPLLEPYSTIFVIESKGKKRHNYYAVAGGKKRRCYIHRLIMDFPKLYVDHVNRNGLDNRRCNLREATPQLNGANKEAPSVDNPRGLCWIERIGRWRVRFKKDGEQYTFGYYKDKGEAIEAAIKAFKELWPEL